MFTMDSRGIVPRLLMNPSQWRPSVVRHALHNMRAAHLLRKLDPEQWGGTEMAIQRLFDGLRGQGITPIVYCPRLSRDAVNDPLLRSGYKVERFRAFVPVLGLPEGRKRQLVSVGGNIMSFDLV